MYPPAAADNQAPGSSQYAAANSQYGNGSSQYGSSNVQYGGSNAQYGVPGQPQQGGYATGPVGAGPAPNARGVQGNAMYGNAMQQGQAGMHGAQGGAGYTSNTPQHSPAPVNSQPPSLSQQVRSRIHSHSVFDCIAPTLHDLGLEQSQ